MAHIDPVSVLLGILTPNLPPKSKRSIGKLRTSPSAESDNDEDTMVSGGMFRLKSATAAGTLAKYGADAGSGDWTPMPPYDSDNDPFNSGNAIIVRLCSPIPIIGSFSKKLLNFSILFIKPLTIPIRINFGTEYLFGRGFSLEDFEQHDISTTLFTAGISMGVEYAFMNKYPIAMNFGCQFAPSSDLGYGFTTLGGLSAMLNFSVGYILGR